MGHKLPTEWQHKMGNSEGLSSNSLMNKNVHDIQKSVIHKSKDSPNITIPEIKPRKTRALTKRYDTEIDEEFKTRSSQLPNSHFKDMPRIIKVKNCEITGHFIPGFVSSENNLHEKPRKFEPIQKQNEFGLSRTLMKEKTHRKINPESTVENITQKNKFNKATYQARSIGIATPIVPVSHERKKILIKK